MRRLLPARASGRWSDAGFEPVAEIPVGFQRARVARDCARWIVLGAIHAGRSGGRSSGGMFRRPASYPSFLERRRARRSGGASRTYTYELAALHIELLVAMAAVDEQVRHIEIETALAFIDRASLPRDELALLEQRAKEAVASPPRLDRLLSGLEAFAGKRAQATMLVTDLARVAAADARADPREVKLLGAICDALGVEHVTIDITPEPSAIGSNQHRDRTPRPPRLVANQRVRNEVRAGLERRYADRDGRAS